MRDVGRNHLKCFEKAGTLWDNCVRMAGVMDRNGLDRTENTKSGRLWAQGEKRRTNMREPEENDGWNTKNGAIWGMSVECIFGWGKQHGTLRKAKVRGLGNVAALFMLNLIGYNLVRIPKLLAETG